MEWSFINYSMLHEKVEPVHSFYVKNALGYTFFEVMFPNHLNQNCIKHFYMRVHKFLFLKAKAFIEIIFSSKLQDIFARGRQGAWSVQPNCQRRQVLQVLLTNPVCTCLDRDMVCYLVTTGRKILALKSAHATIHSP